MLLLENRLKADRDFKKVLKFGTFFSTKNLRMKVMQNNLPTSRFGFVISLKASKKAVVRNRLKRQVREVVRLLLKDGLIKSGVDVSINLFIGLEDLSYQEIQNEVEELFRKAKLLNK